MFERNQWSTEVLLMEWKVPRLRVRFEVRPRLRVRVGDQACVRGFYHLASLPSTRVLS